MFLKNRRHMRRIYAFFIQNKFHCHIYRLLWGRTLFENLPKIPLFGPCLIHQVRVFGSQQHPQIGHPIISFSTWGTENRLAEINLQGTGSEKGL